MRFRSPSGQWINNVEISQALAPFGLVRFALHQQADGSLVLAADALEPLDALASRLRDALEERFGESLPLRLVPLLADDKLRQYTSDLPGHDPAC